MQISHPDTAPKYYEQAGNLRTANQAQDVRTLLNGREGALNNYRLGFSNGEGAGNSEWSAPRHHHNFDQLRYPLEGDYVIGKDEILPAGWVGYFPESAYYGPQTMSANLSLLVMQFGGPSGQGFASVRQRRQGYDDLLARGGKFVNGAYSWLDADGKRRNQDAFEAVWEQMNGRRIVYPSPRYRDIVLMNPAAFDWIKDRDSPGVGRKMLGDFTERHVRVGFIRLDKGARLNFGVEPAPEALVVIRGGVSCDGREFGPLSAFGTEADEAAAILTARESSELYYIKLPSF